MIFLKYEICDLKIAHLAIVAVFLMDFLEADTLPVEVGVKGTEKGL